MQRDIIIDRLRQRAQHHGADPAYFSEQASGWLSIDWHSYHQQVRAFAKALAAVNVSFGAKVAILGGNRLEWVISCLGAQYAGCTSVGIYSSSSPDELSYVVDHSDAQVLVVENLKCYHKQVGPQLEKLSKVSVIVLMSEEAVCEPRMLRFSDFLARGSHLSDIELDERQEKVRPIDVATLIYTSGTTGNPKAVMLSHESIAWTVRTVVQAWRCGPHDKALSYLPLAHVAEQMFSCYAPIDCGIQSYFAASLDSFKSKLKEVEPTVFFGVPRVYEKIYEGIKSAFDEQGAVSKKVLSYCAKVSQDYFRARLIGKMPSLWNNIQYNIAHKKIFQSIKNKIGLGKARLCMVGAAPISKDILNFFCGIDIPIYELYGQSENSGPATICLPGQAKIGSTGKALPCSQVAIAHDGEVMIKGPHVFLGYYKDDSATKEALKDGWLYSGDIGSIDKDGFLFITDRKKDILITAGGKNISPQNIEAMLKQLPYVQSAVVVGDSKKYLVALLSPDQERIDGKSDDAIKREINKELDKLNQKLASVEQIKKFKLLANEFTVESGEFTPTLKVKRKFVNQKYQREIAEMYQ